MLQWEKLIERGPLREIHFHNMLLFSKCTFWVLGVYRSILDIPQAVWRLGNNVINLCMEILVVSPWTRGEGRLQLKISCISLRWKIKECGVTPGNQRSVDKLYYHMVSFRRKTSGWNKVYPELFHLRLGTSVETISPGHICAVSVFQLKKYSFCFPCLLSLFAERDCKFTVADGSLETRLCRPVEHRGADVGRQDKISMKIPF